MFLGLMNFQLLNVAKAITKSMFEDLTMQCLALMPLAVMLEGLSVSSDRHAVAVIISNAVVSVFLVLFIIRFIFVSTTC